MQFEISSTLLKFVEQVSESTNREVGKLTICDLMVGVREERLAEIGSWSSRDLELIEVQASHFLLSDPIESVFQASPSGQNSKTPRLSTPSPVAWF